MEVVGGKYEKPGAGKICKKLSYKSMAIGFRHENVSKSEIGQCRGCGVDELSSCLRYTYTVGLSFVTSFN